MFEYLWNTLNDSDGVHILVAKAWDSKGNLGETDALLVVVHNSPDPPPIDDTPPGIWWEAPESGAELTDTTILRVSFYDESGVDTVRLLKDGALLALYRVIALEGVVEYVWDTQSDSDGVHILEARCRDLTGNRNSTPSMLVTVRNRPDPPPGGDRMPPVINWLSPEPGSDLEGEVHLRFEVMDDYGLDSVLVYLNGQKWQKLISTGNFLDGDVVWMTTDDEDGNYIVQVKAWDSSLNVGLSEVIWFHVWNQRPRTIWVPDEYETIQDAVWHSENGDTIMVRRGEYREAIQMFDKNVSLISEEGPEVTIINSTDILVGLIIGGDQDTSMVVMGFTFVNNSEWRSSCLSISGSSPRVVNNIFTGPDGEGTTGIWTGTNASIIINNLFIDLRHSTQMSFCWGDFSNNMIIRCRPYAFWNVASRGQPLVPDYNLFWDSGEFFNGEYMEWGDNNLFDREPLFEEDSYSLRDESPGVDDGRPDLRDLDGSRSDIGVHGGPHSYTHP